VSIYNLKKLSGGKAPNPRNKKKTERIGGEEKGRKEGGKGREEGKRKEGKGAEQREGDCNSLPCRKKK
jgi:hypothetical protein